MPSRTTSINARSEPGARASIDPDTSTATSRSDRRSAAYQLASTWSTWCGPSTSNSGAFDGREPLDAGRRAAAGAAQAGLRQRPVRRRPGERGGQPVQRRGPGRVRCGRRGRQPAVAQRRGVVARGQDDRPRLPRPLPRRQQAVLGDQPDLAGRLGQRGRVAGDRPGARQCRGQRLGGRVHPVLQPHGLGEGAHAEHAVTRPARVAHREPDRAVSRHQPRQAQPPATRAGHPLRRGLVGHEVEGALRDDRPGLGGRASRAGPARVARPAGVVRDPDVRPDLGDARRRGPPVGDDHLQPHAVRPLRQCGRDAGRPPGRTTPPSRRARPSGTTARDSPGAGPRRQRHPGDDGRHADHEERSEQRRRAERRTTPALPQVSPHACPLRTSGTARAAGCGDAL